MTLPTVEHFESRTRFEWLWATLLATAAMAALLATDHDYAMVWDEGHSIRRERELADWFALLSQGEESRNRAFTPRELASGWPFAREEPDGHPSFYALLGLAGWYFSRDLVGPLTSYRVGTMFLASLTVGIVYLHMARRRGKLAGFTAAGAILLIPQAFSLAHYAHYDMPVSCLWLLAQIAFLNSLKSRNWIIPFGVAIGLAAGTKFTGSFAFAPPLIWVVWSEWISRIPLYPNSRGRDRSSSHRQGTRTLLLGGLVACVTLFAIHPPWWSNPIGGPWRFLSSNLTRSSTIPIPSFYLGEYYRFALPWHNTIVLTAVSIPVGILALGLVGIGSVLAGRSKDGGEGWLWVLSWGTLMVVRALPIAPGHDGIRLILPSVLGLSMLAGLGAAAIRDRLANTAAEWLAPVLAGLALSGGLIGICQLYPFTLSYYNEALGGLKGADRYGFERTYYWDTMGQEFFDWVRRERRRGPLAIRFPSQLINVRYLREWGDLPKDVPIFRFDPISGNEVYVTQRRNAFCYPHDRWLEDNGHPIFAIRRQGVDLLRVYSSEEAIRSVMETRHIPVPSYLVD